jgi:hypothetical protein
LGAAINQSEGGRRACEAAEAGTLANLYTLRIISTSLIRVTYFVFGGCLAYKYQPHSPGITLTCRMPHRPSVPALLKARWKHQAIVAWRIKKASEKRARDKQYVADLRQQAKLLREENALLKAGAPVGAAGAATAGQDAGMEEECSV